MTPSVVANELRDTLLDYIRTTLGLEDPDFDAALQAFLRSDQGLFRGPYLRLGLPFLSAQPTDDVTLQIRPDFTPYAHQLQAFRQLSTAEGRTPANTLVTTGTGSGKTECFLYPILDHCYRHRHEPGIQAILIYPMNALATDQARRLAELIHQHEELHGLRAGLFVGGDGSYDTMGPDHLIDDKPALRKNPPQILLTNYKMLDFLLLRPNDRSLWAQNGPTTLRYLAIDELHTFDGAQGSDVACLLRRLKNRLGTPSDHLLCAGTSATIGSSTDDETFERLADFAETVFGEPFLVDAVVREQRVRRDQLLQAPADLPTPTGHDLTPTRTEPPSAWLDRQRTAWLGHDAPALDAPVAIGETLLTHPVLHQLLQHTDGKVPTFAELERALFPNRDDAAELLQSFLGLVSHARRAVGSRAMPLLSVQVQLWARELRRLLRAFPDSDPDDAHRLLPERFSWFTDDPDAEHQGVRMGPQAHCRECGIAGFAAAQTEADKERGTLTFTPGAVGLAWMQSDRSACFVWPRPLDVSAREGELVHWLDPRSGALVAERPVDENGRQLGGPVVLEQSTRNRGNKPIFLARCPSCGTDDALSIVGARGASLTSVAVTHLYQTPFNDDKKLLAFTDSVQDACHRAGFFGGRTYRIHLRTAIRAVIDAHEGPLCLADAAKAFEAHWRKPGREGEAAFLADFLPPDLRELPEVLAYTEQEGKGSHKRLWAILRKRLGWEITRELGLAAGIGRSLERSAAASVLVDADALAKATERFERWMEEDRSLVGNVDAEHFLFGIVHRLRHKGGIFHPLLDGYVRDDGNRFKLSKKSNPHMSPTGPRTKRIRFLSSGSGQSFETPFGSRALRGWFADWMVRTLDWHSPSSSDLERVYRHALSALSDAGLVEERQGKGRNRVWGLRPEGLWLTTDVAAVRLGSSTRVLVLGRADAKRCDGKPAFPFRSEKRLRKESAAPGFYASVYSRTTTTRVHAEEHTGLLQNDARDRLERRFKAGRTTADPTAPNLLTCTPTLEMGVDIGDLSAAMLCSVPPGPANYLQRVGRAGRKTGNALLFTMAGSSPHDLYFHAQPLRMLDGTVLPPGAYLGAPEMLRRQLAAWCMDAWARDDEGAPNIPGRVGDILGELSQVGFPGRFLEYVGTHGADLAEDFLALFGDRLSDAQQDELRRYASRPTGLIAAVQGALEVVAKELENLESERNKARKRLAAIQADPTKVPQADEEMRELRRFLAVMKRLTTAKRATYPLNVLTDGSVLPNYAFPESGVDLEALITHRDASDERHVERRKYARPAARALRELAPFNTFYAEGHKVEIRQVEHGARGDRIEYWRLCPSCHHLERVHNPTEPAQGDKCPRCGDAAWIDQGQVRAMLRLVAVRSTSDRVRSTIADETEDRDQQRYQTTRLFDVRPENVDGAWVIDSRSFGFEFVRNVTMTELNMGLEAAVEGAPKIKVAGQPASTLGFPVCRDCGEVADTRPWVRTFGPQHAPFCPQRSGDTKPRENLFLYRSVNSEAVRFLLPFSQEGVTAKLASFQAALDLGLRRRFRGQPIHLTVASMTEPNEDRSLRRHYLVLFDTVPGGTGYLAEFREPDAVFALMEGAVEALRACPCRDEGRDGCYLCLYAHGRQRDLPDISSQLAEQMLAQILDARDDKRAVSTVGLVDDDIVIESELEERVVDCLGLAFGADLEEVKYGKLGRFSAGTTTWELSAQQDMSALAGQGSRADLVLRGVKGPGEGRTVVLECDGFKYHARPTQPTARIQDDVAKRQTLWRHPGVTVFSLTWNDVKDSKQPGHLPRQLVPGAKQWTKVYDRVRGKLGDLGPTVADLPGSSPFKVLTAYLRHPDDDTWALGAAALLTGALLQARLDKRLVDGHSAHRVHDHLENVATVFPLPPTMAASRFSERDLMGIVAHVGHLGLAASATGTAVKVMDPARLQLTLRIDDHYEARRPLRPGDVRPEDHPLFADSWRDLLQAMNVFQFLPELEVVSTEAFGKQAAADEDVFADLLAADAEESEPYQAEAPVEQADAFDKAYPDPEVRALVQQLLSAGLAAPDLPTQEVGDGVPAELTWSDRKLAVSHPASLEDEDLELARKAGWTLLLLPITVDRIRQALDDA